MDMIGTDRRLCRPEGSDSPRSRQPLELVTDRRRREVDAEGPGRTVIVRENMWGPLTLRRGDTRCFDDVIVVLPSVHGARSSAGRWPSGTSESGAARRAGAEG